MTDILKGKKDVIKVRRPITLIKMLEELEKNTTTQAIGSRFGWVIKCNPCVVAPKGTYVINSAHEAKHFRVFHEILKGFPEYLKFIGVVSCSQDEEETEKEDSESVK